MNKYLRMNINNEEEKDFLPQKKQTMVESMYLEEPSKKKKKFGVMVDIKQLRGTANMPHL